MTPLRLDIEYDGAAFYGWAAQPGLRTVEGVLTEALQVFWPHCGRPVVAGRTDTGVHASGQVVSVDGAEGGPEPGRMAAALNAHLPADVAVLGCRAGARRLPRALLGALAALRVPRPALARALAAARGAHLALAARPVARRCSTACAQALLRRARLPRLHARGDAAPGLPPQRPGGRAGSERGDELLFRVEADSFLRHMVRTLVGTMVQTACGRAPAEDFERLLEGAERAEAGVTAPPHALCLVAVRYDNVARTTTQSERTADLPSSVPEGGGPATVRNAAAGEVRPP